MIRKEKEVISIIVVDSVSLFILNLFQFRIQQANLTISIIQIPLLSIENRTLCIYAIQRRDSIRLKFPKNRFLMLYLNYYITSKKKLQKIYFKLHTLTGLKL